MSVQPQPPTENQVLLGQTSGTERIRQLRSMMGSPVSDPSRHEDDPLTTTNTYIEVCKADTKGSAARTGDSG
jgi:hypothetical protein